MVFVHASSLEGSAVALLFVGNASQYRSFGGLGFHLVKKASEENNDGDFCPRLQAELQAAFQALVCKEKMTREELFCITSPQVARK